MALLSLLAGVATGLADSDSDFWTNRRQLIIGGNQASSFEHTHQVAISTKPKLQESTFHCGGSLLAADVVLTAAQVRERAAKQQKAKQQAKKKRRLSRRATKRFWAREERRGFVAWIHLCVRRKLLRLRQLSR
mgnify:CR=1 FL=1